MRTKAPITESLSYRSPTTSWSSRCSVTQVQGRIDQGGGHARPSARHRSAPTPASRPAHDTAVHIYVNRQRKHGQRQPDRPWLNLPALPAGPEIGSDSGIWPALTQGMEGHLAVHEEHLYSETLQTVMRHAIFSMPQQSLPSTRGPISWRCRFPAPAGRANHRRLAPPPPGPAAAGALHPGLAASTRNVANP